MAREDDEKPKQDADNALRSRRERTRSRAGDEQSHGKSRRRTPPNALAHDAQMPLLEDRRRPEQSAEQRGLPVARKVDPRAVPPEVTRWFVPLGNTYYHPEGVYAFTDKGDRLTTRSENAEVIDAFVSIARARGWQHVTVSGSDRFKQDTWLAAKTVGLNVRGYEPSELDQRRLVMAVQRQRRDAQEDAPDRAAPKARAARVPADGRSEAPRSEASRRSTPDPIIRGELVDFGPAHYQHLPHKSQSYFVTVATKRGDRTIWGVDLERAMRESLSNPQRGDQVVMRRDSRQSVTVRSSEVDEKGRVVRAGPFPAERTQWTIEKREFVRDRHAAASLVRDPTVDATTATRQRPELLGTYMELAVAEMQSRKFKDPENRRIFMEQIRNSLADKIARGAPLKPVRVREDSLTKGTARSPAADRDVSPHAR